MTRPEFVTAEATQVDADAPVKVGVTTSASTTYYYLTADEAAALAKALADAAVESRPAPCNKPMHKACTCVRPRDHDGPCNCLSRDGSEVVGRGIGKAVSGQ